MATSYSGTLEQDELHYPWGQEWQMAGASEEERYASLRDRDSETSLDPTEYRMYSSLEYRWFTPDPMQADISHPQSMSRYSYGGDNPMVFVDPLGLETGPCGSTYNGVYAICTTSYNGYATRGLATLALAGQETAFLESGRFYGEFYGSAALAGGAAPYFGGVPEALQATSAWMETVAPGSTAALSDFVSGFGGNSVSTVAGVLGALAASGSDIVEEGEDAFDWIRDYLC